MVIAMTSETWEDFQQEISKLADNRFHNHLIDIERFQSRSIRAGK